MNTTRRSFIQACLAAAAVAVDLVYSKPEQKVITSWNGTYLVKAGEEIQQGDLVVIDMGTRQLRPMRSEDMVGPDRQVALGVWWDGKVLNKGNISA